LTLPSLADAVAVNEALRGEDETPEFEADIDELDRVEAALARVRTANGDPIEIATALLFEITVEQGFHEGNKRTAYVLARDYLIDASSDSADRLLPEEYDGEVCDLLLSAARGENVRDEIKGLLQARSAE